MNKDSASMRRAAEIEDREDRYPDQPEMSQWAFVEALKEPLHTHVRFTRTTANDMEADLSLGASLVLEFPDPDDRLATAYADFRRFLAAGGIKSGDFLIYTAQAHTACHEAYRIDVEPHRCRITAADTEGIRRGLVAVEDEMLRAGGPFLPLGTIQRRPLIATRISRCFFGPIKRPPVNRDELIDDINYYPDEYLNRLAHEGVNALWLSVSFRDLCRSSLFPEHGKDSAARFAKLNATIEQCARYGIRIYIFCIEPWGFGPNAEYQHPLSSLNGHHDVKGHGGEAATNFCTSSPTGQDYLESCTNQIFSAAPLLGGLINITLGERPTNCYSWVDQFFDNDCPRCAAREPGVVLAEVASAMKRGMERAGSNAELISWLYVPHVDDRDGRSIESKMAILKDIAARTPSNVTLQYNFESMGEVTQLGRGRMALDYFLSWPGPSEIYSDSAKAAVAGGARASAKIQVGCSHEVATIPFVPVPGHLYQKYRAMHELKVSSVMQCWYFGNYPGLMNKAAGALSFAPFPVDEDEFLCQLCSPIWQEHTDLFVAAVKCFQRAYSDFPVNLLFTHYGPLHHAVAWPLYLYPVDLPIAPSWKFTFPLISGDRIGECLGYSHTLVEALTLLKRMADAWNEGVATLKSIANHYPEGSERALDIGLARALGIQIMSAHNVFSFYAVRENLPRLGATEQKAALAKLTALLQEEVANSGALRELCIRDSRLGFHSEAEGYKYFPENLAWRACRLREVLERDVPRLEREINEHVPLFAEYTGVSPQGPQYRCRREGTNSVDLDGSKHRWQARYDDTAIMLEVHGEMEDDALVNVWIEPCRLWPAQRFSYSRAAGRSHDNLQVRMDNSWEVSATAHGVRFRIPFSLFAGYYRSPEPMRINVGVGPANWIPRHALAHRLHFGTHNPQALGWLLFE